MLQAVKLPASVAHLNACLPNVDTYTFSHSLTLSTITEAITKGEKSASAQNQARPQTVLVTPTGYGQSLEINCLNHCQ